MAAAVAQPTMTTQDEPSEPLVCPSAVAPGIFGELKIEG